MPKEPRIVSTSHIDDLEGVVAKPKRRTAHRKPLRAINGSLDRKIESQLKDIYREPSGKLPNMKNIDVKGGSPILKGLLFIIFAGGLIAALAWAGFFFLPLSGKFSDQQINLNVTGDTEISFGATTTYHIVFANQQKIDLDKAMILIYYPEGFAYGESSLAPGNAGKNEFYIGLIKAREQKEITITGKSYGALNGEQSWRVFLNYTPQNMHSELQKVATLNVRIKDAPYVISLSGADKAAVGDEAAYAINLETKNTWPSKLIVLPIVPANFYFTTSSVPLQKDNTFALNFPSVTSTPNKITINFKGKFSDSLDALMPLKVQLLHPALNEQQSNYLIGEALINTELVKNAISINTAINGSMNEIQTKPGDILNITIAIKNNGQDDLTNGSIRLTADAPSYKKQSVISWNEKNDQFDGDVAGKQISDTVRQGQIVWTVKNIPQLSKLKPGAEVNVDLRLPLKNNKDAIWAGIKEYKILVNADITLTDKTGAAQTISGNPVNIYINSDLAIDVRQEISSPAAEKERHDITWVLTNSLHPLKNVNLSADVFGDATFQGPSSTPAGVLTYDKNTKHLNWNIPELNENMDVLALPFSITLNQKNPTQNMLVSKVHLTAEDPTTGKTIDLMGDEIGLGTE